MKKRNTTCLFTVALFAMLVGTVHAEKDDTVNRGLDWLKSQQREDGSWSNTNYPAMTALGLWAFCSAADDYTGKNTVCSNAAAFVAGYAQADGGIYKPATGGRGSGGLSTYNTAICMLALNIYDPDQFADILVKARAFLAGSQLLGDSPDAGGFGYNQTPPPGRPARADLSNTSWALQAMRETEHLKDHTDADLWKDVNWESAKEFLDHLQIEDAADPENDGSFAYTEKGGRGGAKKQKTTDKVTLRGFGSMTYAGLESMIYADVTRDDPKVQSALKWAGLHWSVDENPGMGSKGLFYYYTVMSKALYLCKIGELKSVDGKGIPWRMDLANKLKAIQKEDGSWVSHDNTFWEGDPMLVTAYSILALQNTTK